jgi:hypothetical protein
MPNFLAAVNTEQGVRDALSFVLPDSNITAIDYLDEG